MLPAAQTLTAEQTVIQEVLFVMATMSIKIIKLIPATIPAQSTQTALTKQLKNIMQLALLEKPAKTDSALTLPAVLTQTAEPTDM